MHCNNIFFSQFNIFLRIGSFLVSKQNPKGEQNQSKFNNFILLCSAESVILKSIFLEMILNAILQTLILCDIYFRCKVIFCSLQFFVYVILKNMVMIIISQFSQFYSYLGSHDLNKVNTEALTVNVKTRSSSFCQCWIKNKLKLTWL